METGVTVAAADTNLATGHNVLGRRLMEVQKGIQGTKASGYMWIHVFTPLVGRVRWLVNNKNLPDISSGKFCSEKIGRAAH